MTETISIKERIERAIRNRLTLLNSGATVIGTVYRWDGRGLRDPESGQGVNANGERISLKPLDACVVVEDETANEGGQGSGGFTEKTLPVEVQLLLRLAEDDTAREAAVINRWLYALERTLMSDPLWTETEDQGNEERLAIDSRITGTMQSPRDTGQRETIVGIRMEVTYEHNRDDPAVGPGITALVE